MIIYFIHRMYSVASYNKKKTNARLIISSLQKIRN